MNTKRKPLLLAALVLILAAVPMLLILETDEGGETAASPEVAGPAAVYADEAPSELPPILYAGNENGEFKIFTTGEDGGAAVPVIDEPATDPAWSPDGETIMFVGEADGLTQKRLGLLRIGPDKEVVDVKKGPQIPSQISFREGTDELAVQSTLQTTGATAGIKYRSSVDSVNTETGAQRTLFENSGSAYAPAWSPDGTRLLVVAGEAGCRSEGICPQRIEMLDPRGNPIRNVIGSGAAGSPAWSPDGSQIVFTWNRGRGPGVWVVDSEGGTPRRVTPDKPAVSDPAFSPDGRRVVFSRSCELFVQPVGGGPAVNITETPDVCEITPDWRRMDP